jgi:hypothetical protein
LTLSALSPPHHRPLPANRSADPRNHGPTAVSTRVLQHYQVKRGHCAETAQASKVTDSRSAYRSSRVSSTAPVSVSGLAATRERC